jgi:hypothetical protein
MSETVANPAFAAAAAAFHHLSNPPKTSKVNAGAKSYWFAPLPEILDAVRPILGAHGLFVRFQTAPHENNVLVTCEIVHASGVIVSAASLVSAGGTNMQVVGSGLTYARRYTLTAALGIAADDDDDGEATTRPPAPQPQRPAMPRPEPAKARPLPPEFLEWLGQNRLTALQFDVWRKASGKPGVYDMTPSELAQVTGWLDGKTEKLATIRGGA